MNYSEYRREFCKLEYVYVKSLREIIVTLQEVTGNGYVDFQVVGHILEGLRPIKEYSNIIKNSRFSELVFETEHKAECILAELHKNGNNVVTKFAL